MMTRQGMMLGGIAACVLLCGCPGPNETTPPATPPTSEASDDSGASVVIDRCASVDSSRTVPVSCKIGVVQNDVVRMQLIMADRKTAEQYIDSAFRDLAVPFCDIANQAKQPAAVVLALYQEQVVRVAMCADGRFGEWQAADPRARQLVEVASLCRSIQSSQYPIGCGMGAVDGVPSLIVSYEEQSSTPQALNAVLGQVGAPFCESTRASGVEALVYLVKNERSAKAYDCATNQETPWITVKRDLPPKHGAGRIARTPVYHRI